MRRRFFIITFTILTVSIVIVSTLQLLFFENERMRLIDQQLQTIASSLIASGLSLDLIENLDSTDDLINELLGEEKIDLIINVYSLNGRILAQNFTASELPLFFMPDEQFQTYEVKKRNVRVLNLHSGNLILQVGIILNFTLKRWSILSPRFGIFLAVISALIALSAFFSSRILFHPLKKVTLELQNMSKQLEHRLGQPLKEFVIGPELSRLAKGDLHSKDEFEQLCAEIGNFLNKLEAYTQQFNAQTAILTHELKTPLTVIRNDVSEILRSQDTKTASHLAQASLSEVDRLAHLINDFLQWSVLTSNPSQPEIYAVKLSDTIKKITSGLNAIYGNRIHLLGKSNATLFAMPSHVEQLITNLLTNALRYSPPNEPVTCHMSETNLKIEDHGHGIEPSVLQKLGQPFNRGSTQINSPRSSGLGLAWAQALCQRYGWDLQIDTSPSGTRITVQF